ncbi:hypothetical protein E2C01_018412 [Portunus trituberculatus]|uniref:Uncharacterized protein n=1 Tax=Portunus trituberculatus TaxID=210409 RepID=A0A5B7DWE0_PORTR|nr:hypothetical protein [Portunus trituberculatus]
MLTKGSPTHLFSESSDGRSTFFLRVLEEAPGRPATATVGFAMGSVDGLVGGPGGMEVEGTSGSSAILLHFLFLSSLATRLREVEGASPSTLLSLSLIRRCI